MNPILLKKRELAKALNVSSRTIDSWVAARKIPVVILGNRCHRFRLDAVLEAIGKLERKAVA
jgi:excisionase family DNA binding protein